MESKYKKCGLCAHKIYCNLKEECVDENYQYLFPFNEVRELDGSYTYFINLDGDRL